MNWIHINANYVLKHEPSFIKEAKVFYSGCSDVKRVIRTRCLITQRAMMYILAGNRTHSWRKLRFSEMNDSFAAIAIEVDVAGHPYDDHAFTLFRDGDQWFIVQSYINRNEVSISPVDFRSFRSMMQRWTNGINNGEWYQHFLAPLRVTGNAIYHIYALDQYASGIDDRINELNTPPTDICSFI